MDANKQSTPMRALKSFFAFALAFAFTPVTAFADPASGGEVTGEGLACNSVSIPEGIPTKDADGKDVVYMSISTDGKYVVSDGSNSGTTMANVPIPLSEVAKIKLSDYGLSEYAYQVDGTDQVTALMLYLYVLKEYYSGGTD